MKQLEIRSILVAVDLSESAQSLLANAHSLATRTGAELHVLTSLEVPDLPYPGAGSTLDFQKQIHQARHTLMEQSAEALPEGQSPTSHCVAVESAPAAILDRAKEVGADLIILGPHRPRAFRGHILGNTADRVLRASNVPVLIIPDQMTLPLNRVVAAIDLSDPARGALDQAFLWAGKLGAANGETGASEAELRVIHVIPRRYKEYDIPVDRAVIGPELHKEIEKAQQRVGGSDGLTVIQEAVWGNAPSEEIVRYTDAEDADFLVLGTHGYGAIGRALIGSVTSRVARSASCTMLLVPPPLWMGEETPVFATRGEASSTTPLDAA